MEADGLALTGGAQAEAPGLDIDAAVPESGLGGGDSNVHGALGVKRDPVVTGGGVGYVDGLAVDGDVKGGGTQLLGDRCGLDAGSGVGGNGKRENGHKDRAKTQQEAKPRAEIGNETTVAPGA